MSQTQSIFRGTPCRAYATFVDPTDATTPPLDVFDPLWPGSGSGKKMVDPTTVTVDVMRGDSTLLVTAQAAVHPSTGRYRYDFTPDAGPSAAEEIWRVRFKGTGANPGLIEVEFLVERSYFT